MLQIKKKNNLKILLHLSVSLFKCDYKNTTVSQDAQSHFYIFCDHCIQSDVLLLFNLPSLVGQVLCQEFMLSNSGQNKLSLDYN